MADYPSQVNTKHAFHRRFNTDQVTTASIVVPVCIFIFIAILFSLIRYIMWEQRKAPANIVAPASGITLPPKRPQRISVQPAIPEEGILEPPPAYIRLESSDPARGGAVQIPTGRPPAEVPVVRTLKSSLERESAEQLRTGLGRA